MSRAWVECVEISPPKELTRTTEALKRESEQRKHALALNEKAKTLTDAILLTEAEIIAGSNPLQTHCGVYFLIRANRVIYVGQSNDVFRRLADHREIKAFDRFAFIPCGRAVLGALEALYIQMLRPPANVTPGRIKLDKLLSMARAQPCFQT